MTDQKRYTLSVGEVANILNVSRQTVHNYAEEGKLSYEAVQRGERTWKLFDPAEVATLAQQLKQRAEVTQ